jgi:hypothetical protein
MGYNQSAPASAITPAVLAEGDARPVCPLSHWPIGDPDVFVGPVPLESESMTIV